MGVLWKILKYFLIVFSEETILVAKTSPGKAFQMCFDTCGFLSFSMPCEKKTKQKQNLSGY